MMIPLRYREEAVMELKERIAARRKELNITLEEVGAAVGVTKSTVRKIVHLYALDVK